MPAGLPPSSFAAISTNPHDHAPARRPVLVATYRRAVCRYLRCLLTRGGVTDEGEVADAIQDFYARMLDPDRFAWPRRGRFRHYLSAAIRNAAVDYFRARRGRAEVPLNGDPPEPASRVEADQSAWLEWVREDVLRHARDALWAHQQETGLRGAPYAALLDLIAAYPEASSEELADRLGGRSAEGIRQMVCRLRPRFAQLIWDEAARGEADPRPENVRDSLAELELWRFVRDYLPENEGRP